MRLQISNQTSAAGDSIVIAACCAYNGERATWNLIATIECELRLVVRDKAAAAAVAAVAAAAAAHLFTRERNGNPIESPTRQMRTPASTCVSRCGVKGLRDSGACLGALQHALEAAGVAGVARRHTGLRQRQA